MKPSLKISSFLLVLSALTACKGGGGGGSGVSVSEGTFNVFSDTSLGISCLGYVMDQTKCQSIAGTWSSSNVADQYGCVGSNSASTGNQASAVCMIDNKKFTATRAVNQASIDTCELFGGLTTPNTSGGCTAAGGSWEVVTAATTTYSCNVAPTTSFQCESVGGTWGPMYKASGRPFPQGGGDLVGVANLGTNLSVPTGYNFSVGTQIISVTGKATLSSQGVGGTDHWQSSISVSRYSDFFSAVDDTIYFQMYFGEEYNSEAMDNGALLDIDIFYKKDI